jgi:26S proteasome regulatory subunit, ATPase 3, interacting protein
MSDTESDY